MGRHSGLVATATQRAALANLSQSRERGEADRARAILWTLEGWDGAAIGRALGVRADRVRKWRGVFRSGGVDVLRARPHPGRPGDRGAAALACAQAILGEAARTVWTLPRLKAEIMRRAAVTISPARLSILLRQKGGSRGVGRGTA